MQASLPRKGESREPAEGGARPDGGGAARRAPSTTRSAPTAIAAISTQIVEELLELDATGSWVGLAEVKTCFTFACEIENDRVAVKVLTPGMRRVTAAR